MLDLCYLYIWIQLIFFEARISKNFLIIIISYFFILIESNKKFFDFNSEWIESKINIWSNLKSCWILLIIFSFLWVFYSSHPIWTSWKLTQSSWSKLQNFLSILKRFIIYNSTNIFKFKRITWRLIVIQFESLNLFSKINLIVSIVLNLII